MVYVLRHHGLGGGGARRRAAPGKCPPALHFLIPPPPRWCARGSQCGHPDSVSSRRPYFLLLLPKLCCSNSHRAIFVAHEESFPRVYVMTKPRTSAACITTWRCAGCNRIISGSPPQGPLCSRRRPQSLSTTGFPRGRGPPEGERGRSQQTVIFFPKRKTFIAIHILSDFFPAAHEPRGSLRNAVLSKGRPRRGPAHGGPYQPPGKLIRRARGGGLPRPPAAGGEECPLPQRAGGLLFSVGFG